MTKPAPPASARFPRRIAALLAAALILLAAAAAFYLINRSRAVQPAAAPTAAGQVFEGAGFSIQIPPGWQESNPQELGAYAQAVAAGGDIPLSAGQPEAGASLVITRLPWSAGLTLEQFVEALAPVAEGQAGAGDIRKAVEIDGQPAIRRDVILPGRSAGEKVRVVQIFVVPGGFEPGRVFVLQVSAPFDHFTTQESAIEAAIQSLQFEN